MSCVGLTYAGHDLLDAIRDPEVWRRTKAAAGATGAWTLDLLKDLATAYVKLKLKEATSIEL